MFVTIPDIKFLYQRYDFARTNTMYRDALDDTGEHGFGMLTLGLYLRQGNKALPVSFLHPLPLMCTAHVENTEALRCPVNWIHRVHGTTTSASLRPRRAPYITVRGRHEMTFGAPYNDLRGAIQ
jgi:hypothetical protein